MTWLIFSLICIFGWGCADLFYKWGTDENDRDSHLKIAVWVGLVMGAASLIMLPFCETEMSPSGMISAAVKYSPASLSYIISMVVGYAGLRYLEISIISPVQNASGALSAVVMLVYFIITGRITDFFSEYSVLDIAGTALIVAGIIALAVTEQKLSGARSAEKKYRLGALALIFPLLYCIFDTIGTAADGIILDEKTGLGLGEIDVLVIYGFTFFLFGVAAWIVMLVKNKRIYNPFAKKEHKKAAAAVCEEFGQIFYVYAMASKPVLAAPMVASYCIVSVILSRMILKEKLKKSQYVSVITVICGIVILGISEAN